MEIIFEDAELLVINKPAGITVNRAETTKHESTVQDWSEEHANIIYKEPTAKFGDADFNPKEAFYQRGGIVHRLDKETSGVLVLAKTPESFVALQKQFREREIKKEYIALAHGRISPKEGEISVPVGRLPWNPKRFGVLPGGKESKTLYKVLSYYQNPKTKEDLTLVEMYPQSGRTHQIRVHLKYINHPIFADFLYAGRKTSRDDRKLLERVFLHAAKITITHPKSRNEMTFAAPLPEELNTVLNSLQKSS